jgi:hypothetical protein
MENRVKFTEVVFARAEGLRGRFLRVGEKNPALYQAVENALISRLGMTGVMQVASDDENIVVSEECVVALDVDWLGVPILQPNKQQLAYYLLGTFTKPTAHDRGAPFHGCLVTASKLKKCNYDLGYFIYAWNTLLPENSQWLTTGSAGKVTLDLTDNLSHPKEDDSEMAQAIEDLRQGKVVRLSRKRYVLSLLSKMLNNPRALSDYSWTTAAFAFPSDPDGAQLHIALSKNRQFDFAIETIRPTLLEDIKKEEENLEEENFASLSVLKEEESFSSKPSVVPQPKKKETAPLKIVPKKKKSGVFVTFGILVVITLVAIVWLTLTYLSGDDSMAPAEMARRLGPSYKQSLDEDVETVALAFSFLTNPRGEQNLKDTIKSLKLHCMRADRIQSEVEKQIEGNWKLIKKHSRWLQVLYKFPDFCRNEQDYSKVINIARLGLERAIYSIMVPSTSSTDDLDNLIQMAKQLANNYPELSQLRMRDDETQIWFNALMETSQEFPSDSYKVLSTFIKDNPTSRYNDDALHRRQAHLAKWHEEESAILAAIYSKMMTGKKSFDVRSLKKAVDRYIKIPGEIPGENTNHLAHKIASAIQELEHGKEIDLLVERISFSDELKKLLAKVEYDKRKSDKKKPQQEESEEKPSKSSETGPKAARESCASSQKNCEETTYKKTHPVEIVTQFNSDSILDSKLVIKDGSGTSIPVTVSFDGSTSIEMKKDDRIVGTAVFPNNLIVHWISKQGKKGELIFDSDNGKPLAKATYQIPKPSDLGFPDWR